jgi:hypothetical protein
VRPAIVPIVEGHGEVEAVPVLLERLLAGVLGTQAVGVARPFRVHRAAVVREGELERAIEQAVRSRPHAAGILLLLDADDDCPAELGPKLLTRCRRATGLPVAVVLATREYEAWFLGTKESLRGVRGITADAVSPANPEEIRGAKERLSGNMDRRRYLPSDDQEALTRRMDLDAARGACASFDKLVRDVQRLVEQATFH